MQLMMEKAYSIIRKLVNLENIAFNNVKNYFWKTF